MNKLGLFGAILIAAFAAMSLGCSMFGGETSQLYARLDAESQAKIDALPGAIGTSTASAVKNAVTGNVPGAIAEGLSAVGALRGVANTTDPDTGLPIGWARAIKLLGLATIMKFRSRLFGSDPKMKRSVAAVAQASGIPPSAVAAAATAPSPAMVAAVAPS